MYELFFTGNEISLERASARLYPDTYAHFDQYSSASVAIDGDNRKGSSGGSLEEILKCASTSLKERSLHSLKYLVITMEREDYVSCVRLHLRDLIYRQLHQNGLTVSVSKYLKLSSASQCGNKVYNATDHGQSPLFVCMKRAKYIWIVLRKSPWPLQVCEVRAYDGMYMN